MVQRSSRLAWGMLVAAALGAGACAGDRPTEPAAAPSMQPRLAIGDLAGELKGEQFAVCNESVFDAPAMGTFDVFEDGATVPTRTMQVASGECRVVASIPWPLNPPGVYAHDVYVEERVPPWWRVSLVTLFTGHEDVLYPHSTTLHPAEKSWIFLHDWHAAPARISAGYPTPDDFIGALASFHHDRIPKGNQACMVRFWKLNPAKWVGASAGDLFVAHFGVDAFPGKTLFDLVNSTDGGLTAAGREAVAAYLNSKQIGVKIDYEMRPYEVVRAFQATTGHPELYGSTRSRFAARNTQGPCPY